MAEVDSSFESLESVDTSTFAAAWQRAVTLHGGAPFLVFEGPDTAATEWTYAEFDHVLERAAATLAGFGVRRGSSVHLALTNSPAFIALWLAAIRLGAWIVPSDPVATVQELAGHIARTHPAVGCCATARAQTYNAAVGGLPVLEFDEADTELRTFGSDLMTEWPDAAPMDRAAVMFTSGTTGRPKGVEVTQANYAFAGRTMAEAAGLQPHHRQLVVLPMFHANAQYYSVAAAIWAGASVALMHTFSASRFLAQAAHHRATHASLFAAPIRMILSRGATPVAGIELQHCWYAMNISDQQYTTFSDLIGCRPRQLYGMTETIPAVLTDGGDVPVPSSIGFVTARCSVAVQRPDGTSTSPDEEGEIVVCAEPGITMFNGYLDDPQTTERSTRLGVDGRRWFLTGDRARCDAIGRFTFLGRRADVLKVAGENVSTIEVEQVLCAHPEVLEAAVIGMPDDVRDEVPVAFVVPRDPSQPPTLEDLANWCSQRLTKAKCPRSISLLDELPRTSVGKIRTFLLKDPTAETTAATTTAATTSEVPT